MTDDNNSEPKPEAALSTPEGARPVSELSDAEKRKLNALRHQVAGLMDELKKLFVPGMKLTFIARNPDDDTMYTFLTEESDNAPLLHLLQTMHKPEAIPRVDTSNVVN